MTRIERARRAIIGLRGRPRVRVGLSDEARVRLAAGVLWGLIAVAAVGGMLGVVRPIPAPPAEHSSAGSPAAAVSEAWAAGGFGARAVAAYLGPGGEGGFAAFLGDRLAGAAPDHGAGGVPPVAVVAVDRAVPGYWAVTVAADGQAGREEFWRIGVASEDGRLVATGLPTPVAAPAVGERPELAVMWETPPVDDPVAATVTGWIAAYVCGQGDVSRWLAPGVELTAVRPPVCEEVRLDRWGTRAEGADRVLVVTEAALHPGASERRVTFALVLARRDGRWEVAELLSAPPLSDEEVDR